VAEEGSSGGCPSCSYRASPATFDETSLTAHHHLFSLGNAAITDTSPKPASKRPLAMCRMIAFSGRCSQCTGSFTWDDVSQRLSCLEAKNAGVFGQCRHGIEVEQHSFDQECEKCTAAMDTDEGYGGIEEYEAIHAAAARRKSKNTITDRAEDGRKQKRQRTS